MSKIVFSGILFGNHATLGYVRGRGPFMGGVA